MIFRPSPLSQYHQLFGGDAAAAAAAASTRPFLLAASLYGVSGLPHSHLNLAPNTTSSTNIGGTPGQSSYSGLPSFGTNEPVGSIPGGLDQRRSSNGVIPVPSTPLDLSHLASSAGQSAAGVRAAAAAAAAVHPFIQLHRGAAGTNRL